MAGRFALVDSLLGDGEPLGDRWSSGEEDEALLAPGERPEGDDVLCRFEKNWRPGVSRSVGVRSPRSVSCPLAATGFGSFCGDDSEDSLGSSSVEPP